MQTLYPEHELLIKLTSNPTNKNEIIPILFDQNIDWNFFINEAQIHGVAALLDEALKTDDFNEIFPQQIKNRLSQIRQQMGLYKLFLHQETKIVLEQFQRSGIPTLLFKGATLVDDIYKDASLRPSSDIDILVLEKDLDQIQNMMFDLGFTFPKAMLPPSFYYRNHFHVAYIKDLRSCSITIEIHWHLMDKYLLQATDLSQIWNRKIPFSFEGVPSNKFLLEDECIYLPLHAFKHGYMDQLIARNDKDLKHFFHPFAENKLMWFVDLQKIITKYGEKISWTTLKDRTQTWGVDAAVRSIYIILKRLYPKLEIPQSYLQNEKSISLSRLKSVLFSGILNTPQTKGRSELQTGYAGFLQKHLFTMKGDFQFRLIRLIDIFEYLFPKKMVIQRLYHLDKINKSRARILIGLIYPIHFIKTILEHLRGLLEWIYYTLRKRITL